MGGETRCRDDLPVRGRGLSPRGRGNLCRLASRSHVNGSIPAWAGKPHRRGSRSGRSRVYPRVGGETHVQRHLVAQEWGLSPRGRGNRSCGRPRSGTSRSIPAWAGKPPPDSGYSSWEWVYPRVGGETGVPDDLDRGVPGLSPRGRGNPGDELVEHAADRSIPAWAGKPYATTIGGQKGKVYPRVGGETTYTVTSVEPTRGLSPRGRGNRILCSTGSTAIGSIPAWAGKPVVRAAQIRYLKVYPRVGGETTAGFRIFELGVGLSPRGRGNRCPRRSRSRRTRSIPAWAGKP